MERMDPQGEACPGKSSGDTVARGDMEILARAC